jgi:ferric-dicitrate binding protein FerR (iron transport regulator)
MSTEAVTGIQRCEHALTSRRAMVRKRRLSTMRGKARAERSVAQHRSIKPRNPRRAAEARKRRRRRRRKVALRLLLLVGFISAVVALRIWFALRIEGRSDFSNAAGNLAAQGGVSEPSGADPSP